MNTSLWTPLPVHSVSLVLKYSHASGSNRWQNRSFSAWYPCPCGAPWVRQRGVTGETFCFYKMNLTEKIGVSWKCSKAGLETSLGSMPTLGGGMEVGTPPTEFFFLLPRFFSSPWKKAGNLGFPGEFSFQLCFQIVGLKGNVVFLQMWIPSVV